MLSDINSFNPDFSVILGDFNAKSKNWWPDGAPTIEGSRIVFLTNSYGSQQLISEPTHILENSSSCIDLILTDQPNLIMDSGTHPSLHPKCHHKIIFCKINLKIIYPPPYRRLVWDFKRACISSIRKAIKMVDWQFMFLDKDTHRQVSMFNDILMNIFTNYIPHKYVTIDDKDPPWMTEKIKNKMNLKKSLYKTKKFIELQKLSTEISNMILDRKEKYYHNLSMKLNNPQTSAKTYWSILKSFYNDSKIPVIPPLKVNNKTVSDFTEKANLFNDFFATQCTPLSNNNVLPSAINFKTHSRLSSIDINEEDILKIIRNLNVNKKSKTT